MAVPPETSYAAKGTEVKTVQSTQGSVLPPYTISRLWRKSAREFLSDAEPNFISHITTDGDITAFRGAERTMAEREQTVEALRVTRNLAQSQKKATDNA